MSVRKQEPDVPADLRQLVRTLAEVHLANLRVWERIRERRRARLAERGADVNASEPDPNDPLRLTHTRARGRAKDLREEAVEDGGQPGSGATQPEARA